MESRLQSHQPSGSVQPRSRRRFSRRFKRLLLIAGIACALLIVLIAVAGPLIVSQVARSAISKAASASIAGAVETGRVRAGWLGPVGVDELILRDPSGKEVARLNASTSKGMLGLAAGFLSGRGIDLGTITLSGAAILECASDGSLTIAHALEPITPATPAPQRPAGAPQPSVPTPTSPAPQPVPSIRGTLNLASLELLIREGNQPVAGLRDITGGGPFSTTQPIDLTLTARTVTAATPITLTLKGDKLFDASGHPTFDQADLTVQLAASVPDAEIEAAVRALLADPNAPKPASAASTTQTTLDGALRYNNSRLTLAGGKPLELQGTIPVALAAAASSPSGGRLTLEPGSRVALTVDRLDLPTAGLASDWRRAALNATLTMDQLAGRFALPDLNSDAPSGSTAVASAWRSFELKSTPMRLMLDPGTANLTVMGSVSATIDNQPAGALALDALIGDALAADGTIAKTLPGVLRAALKVDNVQTGAPWFDLLEQLTGAPIRAALGDRASLHAEVALLPVEQRTGLLEMLGTFTLDSPRTQGTLSGAISSSRVRAHGSGLSIETTAAGPVLEALKIPLSDTAYQLELTGAKAVLKAPAFFVPIIDRAPDLASASGDLTLELRDGKGVFVERTLPVHLQLLRLTTALRPAQPAAVQILGSGVADGAPIQINGSLNIAKPGELVAADAASLGPALLERAGVTGQIRVEAVPTRLLAAANEGLASTLNDAMGEQLLLSLETSEWRAAPQAGANAATGLFTLMTEGTRGRFRGAADVTLTDTIAVATRGNGFQLVLQEPQRLIDGLELEGVRLRVDPPLVVYLLDVDAALVEPTPEVRSGKVEVLVPTLSATIAAVDPKGQPTTINLQNPKLEATLNREGWLDLALNSEQGNIDGKPLAMSGSVGVKGVVARALDHAGFFGSKAALSTRGQWSISGLNANALRVIDPALMPLVNAALTDSFRVELLASNVSTQQGAAGFELRVLSAAPQPIASTTLALGDTAVRVGPTSLALPITEALVRQAIGFAQLDPATSPTLTQPFQLLASASRLDYPLTAIAAGEPIDPLNPGNAWQANVTTSPQDIIFQLPASASAQAGAQPLRIGVRSLNAYRRVPEAGAAGGAGEQGLSVAFFDPPAAGAGGAAGQGTPFGSLTAITSVNDLSTINIVGQSLMLGAIAERFGLGDTPRLALGDGPSRLDLTGGFAGSGEAQRVQLNAKLTAPRLTLDGSLTHDPQSGLISLASPMKLNWNLDRQWIEQALFTDTKPSKRNTQPAEPEVRLLADLPVTGQIEAFDFVLADEAKRRASSLNRLSAWLMTEPLTIVPKNGNATQLDGLRLDIKPDTAPNTLSLALRSGLGAAGSAQQAVASHPVTADGKLRLPASEQPGVLSLTARGDLPAAALDAFARTKKTLAALLGERATFDLTVESLTTDFTAGTLIADMNSPNAVVRLRGIARDGAIELTTTAAQAAAGAGNEVRLSAISPEASRVLFQPLFPIFSMIEKRADQRATLLSIENLSFPIDGDLNKFSAKISLDLGEISFATPPLVGNLLKVTGNRADGTLGTKLQPINITINRGIASYEQMAIPLGEFTLHLSGRVNLVESRVEDAMIYVPIGALVSQFSSDFERIPVVGQIGSAAFRLSGPLEALKIQPVLDPTVLLNAPGTRDVSGNLLRDIIDNSGIRESDREGNQRTADPLSDLLRDIIGRKNEKDKEKDKNKD